MTRRLMLVIVLVFLGAFAVLTIHAAVDRGFTVLSVISLLIIGFLGVGMVGALLEGRDEDE